MNINIAIILICVYSTALILISYYFGARTIMKVSLRIFKEQMDEFTKDIAEIIREKLK